MYNIAPDSRLQIDLWPIKSAHNGYVHGYRICNRHSLC